MEDEKLANLVIFSIGWWFLPIVFSIDAYPPSANSIQREKKRS